MVKGIDWAFIGSMKMFTFNVSGLKVKYAKRYLGYAKKATLISLTAINSRQRSEKHGEMGQLGNKRIRVDIRCNSCKSHLSSSAKFTRRQLNIPDKKQPKEFDWVSER
ncbi:hypothetical protein TNCT_203061 [Trichonephila clavata]|uniref:Uncharacterized protein n=1 Tax=Trichonephila clavata TaxID=2740835 RepID=A0A8X6GB38_TRICU|nr:hypothetical protein TNCT_203061 [Trichonephila clavata]